MRSLFQAFTAIFVLALGFGSASGTVVVSSERFVLDGLELTNVRCVVKNGPTDPVLSLLSRALASKRDALDACDKAGGAYTLNLALAKGTLKRVKVREAARSKSKRCITKGLKKLKVAIEGTCAVTLLLKEAEKAPSVAKPDDGKGASKPEKKPEKKPKDGPQPTH